MDIFLTRRLSKSLAFCEFASVNFEPWVRPKSEIYTPKRDDEHPHPFRMRTPPTPRLGSLKKYGLWFKANQFHFPLFLTCSVDFDILCSDSFSHLVEFYSFMFVHSFQPGWFVQIVSTPGVRCMCTCLFPRNRSMCNVNGLTSEPSPIQRK